MQDVEISSASGLSITTSLLISMHSGGESRPLDGGVLQIFDGLVHELTRYTQLR